ncbi:MAG: tRNA (adenosine(37)-N6)-threonylcarbamoyltransferase complex dimerization subunit type 1 TsaB [Clostridia bacterium]|nr:tRNA (adenosine(37)-N6)-threonylcarbamoyltransferase complex dimerization subunit type 1 TsaB [Clostridia bacterium]
MKILAIDTTSKICSVALLEDEKIIDEINLDSGLTHSENLMPLVKKILEKNEVQLKEINLIGVDVGPGSFTGIRIGVASTKAMAEVWNIPVASITSLETLARSVETNNPIVSLIDARNNQVYMGIFDNKYNKIEEYLADDINIAIEKIKKYETISIVGDGSIIHKELLLQNIKNIDFSENNEQYARNVGKMSYKKYLENDLKNADTVIPIYLRNKM